MTVAATREVIRLTPAVYQELEKKLQVPFVQATTTDLMAGQMIGEQRVLRLLREGYVIGA